MIQRGDFLFYPVEKGSGLTAQIIAWGQKLLGQDPSAESYSHVALVGDDVNHQYEAVFPRIRNVPIRLEGAEIWRIGGITDEKIGIMMDYARRQVGRLYDWIEILTFGFIKIGGTEVCSELVYNAASAAGYALGELRDFQSPDDDAASKLLIRVQ